MNIYKSIKTTLDNAISNIIQTLRYINLLKTSNYNDSNKIKYICSNFTKNIDSDISGIILDNITILFDIKKKLDDDKLDKVLDNTLLELYNALNKIAVMRDINNASIIALELIIDIFYNLYDKIDKYTYNKSSIYATFLKILFYCREILFSSIPSFLDCYNVKLDIIGHICLRMYEKNIL